MTDEHEARLAVTTHWEQSLPVVHVVGDLEAETRGALERELRNVCAIRGDVALDLSGVRDGDMAGFAPLVAAARDLRHRGDRLHARRPSPAAVRLIDALDATGAVSMDDPDH